MVIELDAHDLRRLDQALREVQVAHTRRGIPRWVCMKYDKSARIAEQCVYLVDYRIGVADGVELVREALAKGGDGRSSCLRAWAGEGSS